ncbi:tRNA-2-methylthio-N(6)-dimethylallyladenosine synthase [Dehalogenimonas formicexedens]|uniref:tRNA-2-methylthio-N(6)-dimethylallyladenosine synthase n=2 Tax=Dehalogenimonas formicexedens TaxID=1839801 RepID=A0A1P8F9S5_9CHLR|nr:tRNA-2-methylthio-N(6)-dimethylallyladenosine synthase [Dehalogenimonas formicexedens]
MNQAESERLESILCQKGYSPVDSAETADLVLLVSCAVRQGAEDRITNRLSLLRRLKNQNPSMKIALTGCMVEEDLALMKKQYPMVDYFFSAGAMPDFLDRLPADILPQKPGVSVNVPIIQGCDNFCSYCIVPYRRGRETSRPLDAIVSEVAELVNRGAREVTLLGQNVNAYGHDLSQPADLADLLLALNGVKGLKRIRFLTNHPKDMSPRLIEAMATLDKVCPSLNLPAQAGDDEILARMRRGYRISDYRTLVESIRNKVPGISLTTDIIVGFPGETAEQFANTRRLIEDIRFDAVHLAAYSPRPGTEAAEKFPDDVSREEKAGRLADLEALQTKLATEINSGLVGSVVEVLVEGEGRDKWRGRERSGKLVFFKGKRDQVSNSDLKGRLVPVKITKSGPWSLQGDPVETLKENK